MTEIICNMRHCLWNTNLKCQKEIVQIFDAQCSSHKLHIGDDSQKELRRKEAQ